MGFFRKLTLTVLVLGAAAGAGFWFLTEPQRLDEGTLAQIGDGDAARGEALFWAGGCASCHARPGSEGDARLQLAGGVELKTPFGVFVAPNISPDKTDGIGAWSKADFANAMMRGLRPDGAHLYPAFPYASYARMKPADVGDLFAYLRTLPEVKGKAADHRLGFPFNIRRGLGLWKQLNMHNQPVVDLAADAPDLVRRGQYLVEGPGHCGECHTPRDFTGGLVKAQWLAGANAAEGEGVVPNITGGEGGISSWSEKDIVYFLETGFLPDYDSVGGSMVDVQKNMTHLTPEDRAAIAAYLKAVPPHANGHKAKPASKPAP